MSAICLFRINPEYNSVLINGMIEPENDSAISEIRVENSSKSALYNII